MNKPMFKKGDTFFHPTQRLFVIVDDKTYIDNKGWLYNLQVYNHNTNETTPWKRYYESKIIEQLQPMRKSNAVKILYGNK